MKRIIIALLGILIMVYSVTNALALSIAPHVIRIEIDDGHVFYMTPLKFEERGYPKSGLYRDGELIYTTDAWHFWGTLYFSDDAMTFLLLPPSSHGLIRFYRRGILVRYQRAQDLLRYGERYLGQVQEFTGMREWLVRDETIHDRANNRLQITTVENTIITYDIRTGFVYSMQEMPTPSAIIQVESIQEMPTRWGHLFVVVVSLLAVVCVAAAFTCRRKRKMRSPDIPID